MSLDSPIATIVFRKFKNNDQIIGVLEFLMSAADQPASENGAQTSRYKGFVAGAFSGVAKLSGK